MTDGPFSSLASDYAAALDWWREAGVDCDFADDARGWLQAPDADAATNDAPPPRTVPRPLEAPALARVLAPAPGGAIGGNPAAWPDDLPGFHRFWLTEPSLDPGALADRVAPAGEAGAALMVLVGMPEEDDREALLSGGCGALLTRILAAMGYAQGEVYLASCLPVCMPVPDWADLATRGLAALTCRHIALASPARLITFGRGAAMLSDTCTIPRFAAPQLEMIGRSGQSKRTFWNAWLEWSAPSAI